MMFFLSNKVEKLDWEKLQRVVTSKENPLWFTFLLNPEATQGVLYSKRWRWSQEGQSLYELGVSSEKGAREEGLWFFKSGDNRPKQKFEKLQDFEKKASETAFKSFDSTFELMKQSLVSWTSSKEGLALSVDEERSFGWLEMSLKTLTDAYTSSKSEEQKESGNQIPIGFLSVGPAPRDGALCFHFRLFNLEIMTTMPKGDSPMGVVVYDHKSAVEELPDSPPHFQSVFPVKCRECFDLFIKFYSVVSSHEFTTH